MKRGVQDNRYSTISVLIESGHVKSFRDIFQFIPKTTVYKDLGVNFNRFSKGVHDPSAFSMKELMVLAEMFGINAKLLIDMAYEQSMAAKKRKQKTNL